MADIFISYSSEDRSRVEPLARALENQGWSVFWDRKIPPGKTWDEIIEEAIEAAKCIIVVWTKESVNSGWVRAEAHEGLDREILIPVIIEEVKIPLRFRLVQAANLIGWEDNTSAKGFRQIVQTLASILGSSEIENVIELDKPAGQGLTKKFKNSIGMEFVLIPAGTFMMGSGISPEEVESKYGSLDFHHESEHPQHKVRIYKQFYIQTTPVTQGQWKKVMGDNPSYFNKCGENCPVENVSWDDVQYFIRTLNEMQRDYNYRLPTESEWEYACRAGTSTEFYFGDDVDKLDEYEWYDEFNSHPVGEKKTNPWGLYDILGNVSEWVEDDAHDNYNGAPDDGRAWKDEPRGERRVARGGGVPAEDIVCRSAVRIDLSHNHSYFYVGFRLAASIAHAP